MDSTEQIKKCTKCGDNKLICQFRKQPKGKFGVMSVCKICQSNIEKYNRLIGNSTSVERNKRFRENNPDKIKKWLKTYGDKNKEKRKEYDKNYRYNNKELKNKQSRDYYKLNPHLQLWRSVLKSSLRRLDKVKEGNTIDLLGYSAIELKRHLESLFTEGMSWDNHGEWEIDHIKPVSSFDKDSHPSVVNSLSNLQPLWKFDNRLKSNYFKK
jgi:hypothetical protein